MIADYKKYIGGVNMADQANVLLLCWSKDNEIENKNILENA